MHLDQIEIDYHPLIYSGCSHALAIKYDNTPLVQRLFRMGYCDFRIQQFVNHSAFPFTRKDWDMTFLSFPFTLLTINYELDYYSFQSLN